MYDLIGGKFKQVLKSLAKKAPQNKVLQSVSLFSGLCKV